MDLLQQARAEIDTVDAEMLIFVSPVATGRPMLPR